MAGRAAAANCANERHYHMLRCYFPFQLTLASFLCLQHERGQVPSLPSLSLSSNAPARLDPSQQPATARGDAQRSALEAGALAVLKDAFARFQRIAISFSGAEDVVLIDLAARVLDGRNVPVFSLDTGRLHPETYRFLETVRDRFRVDLEVLSPNAQDVARLVRRKGMFSFYEDGHGECCAVRKIQPLRAKLTQLDAWITGQRADQSVTRTNLPVEQNDLAFSTAEHPIVKFNPLSSWSGADVWRYIRRHDVPYNPLHDQGYRSIGCEPCTRPVGPHQHEREGRWWWENAADKECGLHTQNDRGARVVRVLSA